VFCKNSRLDLHWPCPPANAFGREAQCLIRVCSCAQIKKRLVVAQPSYVIKVVDREGTRVVSTVGGGGVAPSTA